MATPGFPTFALNEIGDDPSSDQITVQSAADVAHQVVRGIARRPLLLGVSYRSSLLIKSNFTTISYLVGLWKEHALQPEHAFQVTTAPTVSTELCCCPELLSIIAVLPI